VPPYEEDPRGNLLSKDVNLSHPKGMVDVLRMYIGLSSDNVFADDIFIKTISRYAGELFPLVEVSDAE
jgi:hypothetical protein